MTVPSTKSPWRRGHDGSHHAHADYMLRARLTLPPAPAKRQAPSLRPFFAAREL